MLEKDTDISTLLGELKSCQTQLERMKVTGVFVCVCVCVYMCTVRLLYNELLISCV